MNTAYAYQGPRPRRLPALLVATAILLLLLVVQVRPADAAERGTIFRVGSTVNIPEADTADSIVAIGGDVRVAGTVREAIVAVGGDVRLLDGAQVGTEMNPGDNSVILVGGTLTTSPGATIRGDTSRITGNWAGDAWDSAVLTPIRDPIDGFSLISWLVGTVLALVGAVLIAALLPHQVTAIAQGVRRRFWPSLGWGALGLIVIVPVVTVLLIVTIVGLLAVLPWLLVVVATVVLGVIGVALLLGELILPRLNYRGGSLILAAVVGVLVLRLVALIPVAGPIATAVAGIVGFGAAVVALWGWQRRRRDQKYDTGSGDTGVGEVGRAA